MSLRPSFQSFRVRFRAWVWSSRWPLVLLIGAAVALIWAAEAFLLAPELVQHLRVLGRPGPEEESKALEKEIAEVNRELRELLVESASGARAVSHQIREERAAGVRWLSLRLDLQLPPGRAPRELADTLRNADFTGREDVKIQEFTLEALSPSVQISVRGYPTHRITIHPTLPQEAPVDSAPDQQARIAILIDDLGMSRSAVDPLLKLDVPFSIAIVPFTPFALATAEKAHAYDKEILVHLPMEPLPRPSGKLLPAQVGELRLSMSAQEIRHKTRKALLAVPYAVGINNHQGSAFTRDRARMTSMLEAVQAEGMFFVDSKTISGSKGVKVARALEVPVTRRDVFIDVERDPEKIRRALGRLKAIALKQGQALGIAHPHRETIEVLKDWLIESEEDGFEMVPVSSLLSTAESRD